MLEVNKMRINLETDYAVRIVDAIARSEGQVFSAEIAQTACIPQSTVYKVLRTLTSNGITIAHTGPYGGYELARPIEDITVYDVLYAMEGPIALNRCLLETEACTRVPDKDCSYHHVFSYLTNQVRRKLASISFADVINAETKEANRKPDMKNRYMFNTKLSEEMVRKLLKCFADDVTAKYATQENGLNVNTTERFYLAMRKYIASQSDVTIPEDDDFSLYAKNRQNKFMGVSESRKELYLMESAFRYK
jgi:Rrf2 family protein